MAGLSGQERVRRMLRRQDHDRVPRHETFWQQTIDGWASQGLVGGYAGAWDLVGSDFEELGWNLPVPFPGQGRVLSEDQETRVELNEWGETVRVWKSHAGTPEHIGWSCSSRDEWERRFKPAVLASAEGVDYRAKAAAYERGRRAGRWTCLITLEGFEVMRHLLGDLAMLEAMIDDPQWIADISSACTDANIAMAQRCLDLGLNVDGIWCYGDMAFRTATFCSPALYRQLIWPDHQRLCAWAHDHGMDFIFHSDGDLNGVVGMYVEAGFDCLQPLEAKANMDLRTLAPRYGKQLAFMGNIDVMVLASNDRARIEAELRPKLTAGMATRGYGYHSDHSIPPTVTLDTFRYLVRLLDRYGNYDRPGGP